VARMAGRDRFWIAALLQGGGDVAPAFAIRVAPPLVMNLGSRYCSTGVS
jgi:hypothetical protein